MALNDLPHIDDYIPSDVGEDDFYNQSTITFGELLEIGSNGGIDWTAPEWIWNAYDDAQRDRVNILLDNHYYDREIGVLPPNRWRRHFIRKLNESMSNLLPYYRALETNPDLPLSESDVYDKGRTVFSDFPATQLSESEDYASNATDRQSETVSNGDFNAKLHGNIMSVDMLLVESVDSCFSSLYTVSISAY
jgi:hypothetical protein